MKEELVKIAKNLRAMKPLHVSPIPQRPEWAARTQWENDCVAVAAVLCKEKEEVQRFLDRCGFGQSLV